MKKIRVENIAPISILALFVTSILGAIAGCAWLSAVSLGAVVIPFMGYMIVDLVGGCDGE